MSKRPLPMRLVLVLVVVLGVRPFSARAQVRKPSIDPCVVFSDSMTNAYIEAMKQGDWELAGKTLNHWEKRCGVYEPQLRARALLAIRLNGYEPQVWDSILYEQIFDLQWRRSEHLSKRISYRRYQRNPGIYGYVPLNHPFDSFTMEFAQRDLFEQYSDFKPSERIVLESFRGKDSAYFKALQTTQRDSSILAALYQDEVQRAWNLPEGSFKFSLGIWSPEGDAALLGKHPVLGFQFGSYKKKWGWEADFEIRFLRSRDSFWFTNQFVDLYTDRFSGWNGAFYLSRNVSTLPNTRLNLKAGVAWDALAISEWRDDLDEPYDELHFAHSPALVGGLDWMLRKYPFSYTVGYTAHWMNYSLGDKTTIRGYAHTVRFAFGFLFNDEKERWLEALHQAP